MTYKHRTRSHWVLNHTHELGLVNVNMLEGSKAYIVHVLSPTLKTTLLDLRLVWLEIDESLTTSCMATSLPAVLPQ